MNIDINDSGSHLEKLDADAVCIQCGTVNAEGTLLCKVCGNNLRDQRNRRLASDQALEMGPGSTKPRAWLSPLLFIMGVAAVISTLYNQDMIIDWMMGMQSGGGQNANSLWKGEEGAIFDALIEELQANRPTEEVALSARSNVVNSATMDGIYVLFSDDVYVGAANVMMDGEDLYFGALLETGERLRGRATHQGNYYILLGGAGALRSREGSALIQGVASPQKEGFVECMGDDNRAQFTCVAYRVATS